MPASAAELVTPPPTGGAGGTGFGAGGAAGLAGGAGAAVGGLAFDTDAVGLLVPAAPTRAARGGELAAAALEAGALDAGADLSVAGEIAALTDDAGAEGGAGAAFLAE